MYGGEISGNTASDKGGAVYAEGGTVNISGNPVVKNNTGCGCGTVIDGSRKNSLQRGLLPFIRIRFPAKQMSRSHDGILVGNHPL